MVQIIQLQINNELQNSQFPKQSSEPNFKGKLKIQIISDN